MRRHLAARSMQRVRTQSRAVRAAAVNLKIDEAFVARLTDFISELSLKGMAQLESSGIGT